MKEDEVEHQLKRGRHAHGMSAMHGNVRVVATAAIAIGRPRNPTAQWSGLAEAKLDSGTRPCRGAAVQIKAFHTKQAT